MTRTQTLVGVAVLAVAAGGAAFSIQATKPAAQPSAPSAIEGPGHSSRSCVDMDGKAFAWSWSNVPFASTCDARPDAK
jgi:hypothetical protein